MSSRRKRLPSYRLHRPSGLAVVTIDGRDHYLGQYGTPESRQKYGELISQAAIGVPVDPRPVAGDVTTVAILVAAYMKYATQYYVKNGKVTDEVACIRSAMAPLLLLFAECDVARFSAPQLVAVRQQMIANGWTRKFINKSVGRIRRMFRHGVANELVPPDVLTKLSAVTPLAAGRSEAVERPERHAVPEEHLLAVRDHLRTQVLRDLMDVALLTAARPGELCRLTMGMLDRSGDVWKVVFRDHKMAHLGRTRTVLFGPRSQLILRRYLKAKPEEPVFGVKRATFSNNLKAVCKRLKIPVFTGHWLRHTALTEIRREFGLDAAQTVADHGDSKTTEMYAAPDRSEGMAVAMKRG